MKTNPPLSFKEAIIECFKKSLIISGRSRRSEFWNFFLFFFIQITFYLLTKLLLFLFIKNSNINYYLYN